MGISNIINNKPHLYHYTNPAGLVGILSTRSLWANPTWGFKDKDKEEYVFGLKIIASWLKRVSTTGGERVRLPRSTLAIMDNCGADPCAVLQRTIAHIDYELAHPDDPRVKVYVACVSANAPSLTDPATLRMLKEYGECVIHFNWALPLIGYAWPRPFVMSMLSWVCYDPRIFELYIPQALDLLVWIHDPESFQKTHLQPYAKQVREKTLATTLAVLLCNFAANIKQKDFEYEHEWRLKTIAVDHEGALFTHGELHWLRGFFRLPEAAEWTSACPRRYIQQLTFHDRMIIYPNCGILKKAPIPADFANTLRDLQVRVQAIQAKQGAVLGEAAELRELLLRWEREGYAGLSPDNPIV